MTIAESSWWHGRATDRSSHRAEALTSPRAERSLLQRWCPTLAGWIRLGAPISSLDPTSIARLLALTTALTVVAMVSVADLAWQLGTMLASIATALLGVTYLRSGGTPRVISMVLLGSFTTVMCAIGFAGLAGRTGVALPSMAVAALFVGLFMRLKATLVSLSGASILLLVIAQLTGDRLGVSNAVTIVAACWLVASMSAAMAAGARQAGSLDADTGVPNARGIQRALLRSEDPALIATIRLVGVAAARDALGHDAASELMRCVTRELSRCTTASMRLGRVGDDELVIVVPIELERDDAERLVLRTVTTALGDGRYLIAQIEVAVEAHIGIAVWQPAATAPAPFLRRAPVISGPLVRSTLTDFSHSTDHAELSDEPGPDDAELQDRDAQPTGVSSEQVRDVFRRSALAARQAADAGVAIRTWDGQATTLTADDLELLADLRTAIQRRELSLAYQPQVRVVDGAVASVEALMRWNHPERGIVSPERFVDLAERTGLIDRLTDWVFGEALDAQLRWRAAGVQLDVSVNVSPLSLRRTHFAGRVSEAIVARGLPASILTVEVTESSSFDVPQAVKRLAPLRALGVRISIDDFGTGYTSLAILPELAIDEIKIDQCFVRNSVSSPANGAIVRSMCELAHQLGLSAVAEGAETDDIVDRLRVAGYDLVQGYVFSAPLTEVDLLAWLERRSNEVAPTAITPRRPATTPTPPQLSAESAPGGVSPVAARGASSAPAVAPVAARTAAERLGPLPTISFVGAMAPSGPSTRSGDSATSTAKLAAPQLTPAPSTRPTRPAPAPNPPTSQTSTVPPPPPPPPSSTPPPSTPPPSTPPPPPVPASTCR